MSQTFSTQILDGQTLIAYLNITRSNITIYVKYNTVIIYNVLNIR